MIVFCSLEEVLFDFGFSVVVIGKFDGVYIGYCVVIDCFNEVVVVSGSCLVVVMFDCNLLVVL